MSVMKRLVLTAVLVLASSGIAGVMAADQGLPRVAFLGFSTDQYLPSRPCPRRRSVFACWTTCFSKSWMRPAASRWSRFLLSCATRWPARRKSAIATDASATSLSKPGPTGAAWGTVQKVSNLILNINVYMEDAHAKKMEFAKSVDIRGNTDESWQRGLDYMLRHYLFQAP
jgi:hypothetical protein